MTKTEIKGHESMKKAYPNYPSLPKVILGTSKAKKDKGHIASCVRGFEKRVTNWENNHARYLID